MARRLKSLGARVRLSPRARRNIVVSLLAVVAFGLAVLMAAWNRACAGNSCPSIAELGAYDPNQASKVYAADGRLITDLGQERRTVVPLGEMSPVVKAAFVTTEDKRFYEHEGIDWYRVLGAIRSNLVEMRVAEGFSTITMQLARNIWTEDIGSCARRRSPARSRRSTPRIASSSSTSIRSTWGTAPSGWRPPPSAISGSRSAT
jgi:membrane carboxypeptidase/penicillin-binding protein